MKPKVFLPLLLLSTVIMMWVALYNGFPLVEGDTGAYIQQAIYPHFAADRPPFYGLFIRATSLSVSLWWPVAAQCFIVSFLLLQFTALIGLKIRKPDNQTRNLDYQLPIPGSIFLISIVATAAFTCLPWVTAYLMPDIFAGILLLSILLFISGDNKLLQAVYACCIFFSLLMHNSHFVIGILFSGILLVYALMKKDRRLAARNVTILALAGSVWAIMCSMNAMKHYGFTFSRGKDIYLMAKLAETGILKTYLDDNCSKKDLRLCQYKSQMPPTLTEFLWSGESPLYKLGGWDSNKAEYAAIAHDIYTTPKYLGLMARQSAISTAREITLVHAPNQVPVEDEKAEPWKKIKQYFSHQMPQFTTSKQNRNAITASACNIVYDTFFILSTVALLLLCRRMMNRELLFIFACILLFLLINAFVTATFSTVIYRFQYRVFWVLPATNAIVLTNYFFNRRAFKNVDNVFIEGRI